jgi:short-subunit dehydrogenase
MPTALITGASSGIGLATARIFAQKGYDLILVSKNNDRLETARTQLAALTDKKISLRPLDLTDPGAAGNLFAQTEGQGIKIDVLINNAGFGDYGAFLDANWSKQESMVDLNIKALMHLSYLFGQAMRRRHAGRILNVASIAAFAPGPYMPVYYASKSFVLSFSLALRKELAGSGVTITALCPGPTATNFEIAANMAHSHMFQVLPPATADQVAKAGYKALMAGRAMKVYGHYWLFDLLVRLIPRSWAVKITEYVNYQKRP